MHTNLLHIYFQIAKDYYNNIIITIIIIRIMIIRKWNCVLYKYMCVYSYVCSLYSGSAQSAVFTVYEGVTYGHIRGELLQQQQVSLTEKRGM